MVYRIYTHYTTSRYTKYPSTVKPHTFIDVYLFNKKFTIKLYSEIDVRFYNKGIFISKNKMGLSRHFPKFVHICYLEMCRRNYV